MNLDLADGRPVEIVLDLERLAAEQPRAAWSEPSRCDMWRFGALMALDVRDPRDAAADQRPSCSARSLRTRNQIASAGTALACSPSWVQSRSTTNLGEFA